MDKKIAGLLGAVSACLVADGTAAMATPVPTPAQPQSYADLLAPIPNAKAALAASDAQLGAAAPTGRVQVAETIIIKKGRRHHHHHHHFRRHHHHHHHHY